MVEMRSLEKTGGFTAVMMVVLGCLGCAREESCLDDSEDANINGLNCDLNRFK